MIKKISEVKKANFQKIAVSEYVGSGYSRMMRILKGQVPTIHTFGIISADNPQGKKSPAEENNRRQEKMKKILSESFLGYIQHKGKYGSFEKPFLIFNIQKDFLLTLGDEEHFDQESVIFGQVAHEDNSVLFQYLEHGKVTDERNVVLTNVGDREDFYSEYKGRKFYIPFFDEVLGRIGSLQEEVSNLSNPQHFSCYLSEVIGSEEFVNTLSHLAEKIKRDTAGDLVGLSLLGARGQVWKAWNSLRIKQ